MDSVGVGELPDAWKYGDAGSNTVANIARTVGGLRLPSLERLGLGNIIAIEGVPPAENPAASYGKMGELSPGKDTTTGHWEIAGLILERPFPVYPQGFPPELVTAFEKRIGRKILGNKVASGTAIIDELGAQHLATGYPIVYTSADSVFQIAAHEEVIPLEELYRICLIAREMLTGEYSVARVIARPFIGVPGGFKRIHRHEYSIKPQVPTVLNLLRRITFRLRVGKIGIFLTGKISEFVTTKGIGWSGKNC